MRTANRRVLEELRAKALRDLDRPSVGSGTLALGRRIDEPSDVTICAYPKGRRTAALEAELGQRSALRQEDLLRPLAQDGVDVAAKLRPDEQVRGDGRGRDRQRDRGGGGGRQSRPEAHRSRSA